MLDLKSILTSLKAGEDLTFDRSYEVINHFLSGTATPVEIASILSALAVKGESVDEIVGAASAMRQNMTRFEPSLSASPAHEILDNCGTGGTGISTINSSTVSAIVAASCGVKVAKHGNVTSGRKSGSANWLHTAGMPQQMDSEQLTYSLDHFNFCFLFAPQWHPAMRHVGPIRKELGMATLFNMLGPLCNPAQVKKQIIGVANKKRADLIAGACLKLGFEKLFIIYSEDGLDDISPSAPTHIYTIKAGAVSQSTIHPSDFGLKLVNLEKILVDSPQDSYAKSIDALKQLGAGSSMLAMNAGMAMHLHDPSISLSNCIKKANASLESGHAFEHLQKLQAYWNSIST